MQKQRLISHFIPLPLQLFYSLTAAWLIGLYWSRNQLVILLTNSTGTSSADLNKSFTEVLNQLTNNHLVSTLSVVMFWALAGLIVVAIIYESINILILAWNDYVITSTYTKAKEYKNSLIKSVVVKMLLAVMYLTFMILSMAVFKEFWHSLINQPASRILSGGGLLKECLGVVGLAANIYIAWMGSLAIMPRFF